MLYTYPDQAHYGKMIAKSKIYEHANISTALKEKFIAQIDKITWQFKLAPETINLTASSTVPEIQIFDIRLKGDDIDEDLLRVIDRAIPFPIIYQIHSADKIKVKAAYKRPSDADKNKWVVESYFESDWIEAGALRESLPVALDLTKLYEQMLKVLMPSELNDQQTQGSLKDQVDKIQTIQAKERVYEKLKVKRDKEKQFNRKAELNSELKMLKKELDNLKT